VNQNSIYPVAYIGNITLPEGPNPFIYVAPPTPPTPAPTTNHTLGIVLGVVAFILITVVVGYLIYRKNKQTAM
jgi:hypothetical protein